MVGNAIEKGPKTQNSTVVSYGEEGIINGDSEFYFTSNSIVTDRNPTTFLIIAPTGYAQPLVANNIFAGPGHPLSGNYTFGFTNVVSIDTAFFHFRDPIHYDYHPTANFPGLYSAVYPAYQGNEHVVFNAESEYVQPMDSTPRSYDKEVGAFEAVYPDTSSDSIVIVQSLPTLTCVGDTSAELISVTNDGNIGNEYGMSSFGIYESDFVTGFGGTRFIQPGESDTFILLFIPSINGVETDTLRIDGGTEHYLPIQATGGAAIISGHDTISAAIGSTSPLLSAMTICNTGTCTWTPGVPTGDPQFTFYTNTNGELPTINPGDCIQLSFTFTPTSEVGLLHTL